MLRNRMRLISILLFSIILQADNSITSYFMMADKLILIASFLEKKKNNIINPEQPKQKWCQIQKPRGSSSTTLKFRKPGTGEVWRCTYSVTSLNTMQMSGRGTVGEEGFEEEDVDA